MNKRKFLFLTFEGFTYSQKESIAPDVENIQVIGYSEGKDEYEAFNNFVLRNSWILDTGFNEIICIEVKQAISEGKRFYLEEFRSLSSQKLHTPI
ncbi:hypothetical protein [Methanotorris igneus]|uniref:Uncharacterized protein n=1 Tax=Methanotorris igneus (strain DSM 5666 / JCM 11834 / Kol 5) TaxID=880724 RepID=F6BCK6_METIK|nr:hypothetical protein [Methanotorris igneus]AEF96217.1 hypothetical protein Metig_0667 [Methanotorris igneus Kol 5]